MFIGIKMTPQKTGKPVPSVFYCGLHPAALRAEHAKLLEANEDGSRFFMIQHPMMVPLQNVITGEEDHPDIVAAQGKRAELAKGVEEKAPETKLQADPQHAQVRQADLLKLKLKELQAIVERFKATGVEIETGAGTKAELVDGILKAEGLTPPAEDKEGDKE